MPGPRPDLWELESEPDWSGDADEPGEAGTVAEEGPDDTVGSATVDSTINTALSPEQLPQEPLATAADPGVLADLADAANRPVPPDTPHEVAYFFQAGSKSMAKPKQALAERRQTQPGAAEQPRTSAPSSSEPRRRAQQGTQTTQEQQQRPQQRAQPMRQDSPDPQSEIIVEPRGSIPESFFKELDKSHQAAAALGPSALAISNIIRGQAQIWRQTGRVEPIHEGRWDGLFICMCTTMFRREASWKAAFPLQLAVAMMFVPRVKICLVTFAEDTEAWAYCSKHAQWAFDLGILYMGSAGEMAGEVVPSSLRQRYWHASQCKNAAHVFAAGESRKQRIPPQNVVLVNVDADNIVPPSYLEALLVAWQAELQGAAAAGLNDETAPGRPLLARGAHGALTGRIALSLSDFARLGGYDQEPCIWHRVSRH